MEILDQPQRRAVLDKVLETVSKKFVAPTLKRARHQETSRRAPGPNTGKRDC